MDTTAASRPSPASNVEIVHSYPFLQFCCITNIKNTMHDLFLQEFYPD